MGEDQGSYRANKQPNSSDRDCLAENQPQDFHAGSSQRHTNPEFVRAFRYRVRNQPVSPNGGKNKSDGGKYGKQPCLKTPAVSEPFELRAECRDFEPRNLGANVQDRGPDLACKREPILRA